MNTIRMVKPGEEPDAEPERTRKPRPVREWQTKPMTLRRLSLGMVWWLMHVVMLPVMGLVGGIYGGLEGSAAGFGRGVVEALDGIAKWRRMMDRN